MKIVKKNTTFFLNIESKHEEKVLEDFLNKTLDINKISSTEVLLSVKNLPKENSNNFKKVSSTEQVLSSPQKPLSNKFIKDKIIALLNNKNLSFQDKVEGSFENLLNKEDLPVLKEMLISKEIEIFKSSEKYKKGIYQISTSTNQNSSSNDFSFFDTEKYIIISNSEEAKLFSSSYETQIKSGDIIGIKSFDGNYYVINKFLFSKIKDVILSLALKNTFTIDFLTEKTAFPKSALKVTIEILKEEGLMIEKKKEIYQFL